MKEKGDIIYRENAVAEAIYVIYSGECELYKNDEVNSKNPNEKFKEINHNTNTKILTLMKGDFAGFESTTQNKKYHSTLVVKILY